MDWQETYHSRIVSSEQAVEKIQSGYRVYLTGNCSVPHSLLKALVKHAPTTNTLVDLNCSSCFSRRTGI